MTVQKYPKVSVVICSFNGSRGIAACLKGLQAQTYPADRFSVVVVDDGSTDGTGAIAQSYGVQVVRHSHNLGVQHARNTGIRFAKGELIAFLDDDCSVDRDWLAEIVAPFDDKDVAAVGGQIVAHKTDLLSERYMEASGYGNPEPLATLPGSVSNPLRRVGMYLSSMYRPISTAKTTVEAQAVYTANVAYRASALKKVGGFDSSLRSNEDSDLATRLRAAGYRLMYAPAAKASHRHHQRIWHFIRQTFYRSGDTLQYYQKNNMLPPLFPFPVLYVGITFGLLLFFPLFGTIFALVGPVLLYNSWIVHGMRARKLEYVLYAYIQMAREAAGLLGFLRGALRANKAKSAIGSYATRNELGAKASDADAAMVQGELSTSSHHS